jgi:hypothetical protein
VIPPEEWRWTGRRDRFAGYTHGSLRGPNQGEFDAWVAKFDAHGRLQWKRQLETVFDDAAQGSDGERQRDVVIAGETAGELCGTHRGAGDALSPSVPPSGRTWGLSRGVM